MDIVILFKSEFWDDYFFFPYASIFYIINVNYVVLRKAYIYFLRNFLKKCYLALKHSKQINYSGTEICI